MLLYRSNGERYRREFLAHGGEKHPKLLIEGNFCKTSVNRMNRLIAFNIIILERNGNTVVVC